jgi:hypothetical protein
MAGLTFAAIMAVTMASWALHKSTQCFRQDGASICLVAETPHTFRATSSGLKAGTTVREQIAGPHVSAAKGPPFTFAVDSAGHLPRGQGVIVPAGSSPVTITLAGTTASGSPITATFTR